MKVQFLFIFIPIHTQKHYLCHKKRNSPAVELTAVEFKPEAK